MPSEYNSSGTLFWLAIAPSRAIHPIALAESLVLNTDAIDCSCFLGFHSPNIGEGNSHGPIRIGRTRPSRVRRV